MFLLQIFFGISYFEDLWFGYYFNQSIKPEGIIVLAIAAAQDERLWSNLTHYDQILPNYEKEMIKSYLIMKKLWLNLTQRWHFWSWLFAGSPQFPFCRQNSSTLSQWSTASTESVLWSMQQFLLDKKRQNIYKILIQISTWW